MKVKKISAANVEACSLPKLFDEEKIDFQPMFQAMRDALSEQKQNPLSIDDVTAMITGQIGQLAPMDEETADLFQQLAKKMMTQMSKDSDEKKGD